jgi:hypothetical protein
MLQYSVGKESVMPHRLTTGLDPSSMVLLGFLFLFGAIAGIGASMAVGIKSEKRLAWPIVFAYGFLGGVLGVGQLWLLSKAGLSGAELLSFAAFSVLMTLSTFGGVHLAASMWARKNSVKVSIEDN